MDESSPRITPSHAAEESEGRLFGVATHSLLWVTPALAIALGLFVMLAKRMSLVEAASRSLLPALIGVIVLGFFQRGQPFGFFRDLVENVITGGSSPVRSSSRGSRSPLFNTFPDGYVSDGLLVFGGLSGQVARGYWIQTPDLRNASFSVRNRVHDTWATMLRLIPENWSLQIREFDDDRGFAPRLMEYAERTSGITNLAVRKLRNANFVWLWSLLEKGQLRQRRLCLFVGYRIPGGAQGQANQLAAADQAFRQFELTLQQLLERVDSRVIQLSDADLIRQWADAFNPSHRGQRDLDPAATYDHSASLLDNVWHSEVRGCGNQGFVLDGYHHLGLSLKRLPAETYPTILHSLASLPFGGVTITVQIRRLAKEPLVRREQSKLERIHQQLLAKPNPELSVSQDQIKTKLHRLTADGVVPLGFELIVVIRAKSSEELLDRAAAVKAAIQRMNGAQVFEASLATSSRSLFAKSLPGCMWSSHQGYRLYMEDSTAANLLPLVASFVGHPGPVETLYLGADGGVANIATFLGMGAAETPQTMTVLGATGVGKSNLITNLLISTGADIGFSAVIENGLSQASYTRAMESEPILFKPGGGQTINFLGTDFTPRTPFWISTGTALLCHMIGVPRDEDKARRQHALTSRQLVRVSSEQAEDCLRRWPVSRREAVVRESAALTQRILRNPQSLQEAFAEFREFQRTHASEASAELAQFTDAELREHEHTNAGQLHDLVLAHLNPEEHLTLSSLRESLELSDDEECRWLAVLLAPWCRDGAYGNLFDGPSNVSMSSKVLHVELGYIPEGAKAMEGLVAFSALSAIRDKCLSLPRSVRKRVVIDEVSRFLDVPGGEAILREFFESFRKHNNQIIIIGQQYSRIADSSIRAAIVGGTRAWLIFNTGDATDIARLGADLGLSKASQEAIRRFALPDQMTGQKYSEFLYYHTDARQPICGVVRHFILPTDEEKAQP